MILMGALRKLFEIFRFRERCNGAIGSLEGCLGWMERNLSPIYLKRHPMILFKLQETAYGNRNCDLALAC